MQTYVWVLLVLCHYPDEFVDHRDCESRDIMFSMCDVRSPDQMLKELCKFMSRNLSPKETTLSCLVAIGLVQVEI